MKTNRILIGILAFVLVAAIATSGYMLGYANAQSNRPEAVNLLPEAPATEPSQPSASSGSSDVQPAAPPDQSLKTFWEAYSILQKEYYGNDLPTGNKLQYDAIQGMLFGLGDQFTSFIPPDAAKFLREDSTGSFSGIGAYVQLDKNRALEITKVFPGSPAEKAGLKPGDLVTEVDGKSIVGQDLDVQVSQVRGPEGSTATFTIVREGEDKPLKVDITRAKIEIKLVESKMLDNNIAYIALSSFNSATAAQQLQAAIQDALAKNPKGLIFDLRDNGGGLLTQAEQIADMFLKDGVVLYERTKEGQEKVDRSTDTGIAQDIPLVVLVNGHTASASEIVSGAIQDRGRGVLIGETTFGKGAVQAVHDLSDGSQLRVTFEHWFTPNNHDIHGKGIEPNIKVDPGTDPKKDPQLDRAVEYLMNGQ